MGVAGEELKESESCTERKEQAEVVAEARGQAPPTPTVMPLLQLGRKIVTRDWKSFYSSMSIGSGSRPSTHESQIGVAAESEEIHQELVVVYEVESTGVRTEQAEAQTQDEEETAGTNLIREFDANLHVIADPRC